MFSKRTTQSTAKNALTLLLEKVRAGGRRVLDLTESNPTRAGVPYADDEILRALSDRSSLTYDPAPFGIAEAREAVAAEYARRGVPVDPSRVVLTASTSEAYSFLFKLLCDPGDDVLAPRPSYPLFDHLAAFEDVTLRPYRLAYDGAWHVDLGSARRAPGPRSRAVLLVSPNNPTGSYVTRTELEELATLGPPLVSDEVFAGYDLRVARHATSALALEDHLVFALGGLSKLALLPQMKVAWIVVGGPDRVARPALERLELVADAFLSVATPQQRALPALLRSRTPAASEVARRTRANLASLERLAAGSPVTVLDVEAGWYACLRLPATATEETWTLGLLDGEGVYAHPGHFFDFAEEPVVVVSLLAPQPVFDEGIGRLVAHVSRHAPHTT